jgi:hypothetical protein
VNFAQGQDPNQRDFQLGYWGSDYVKIDGGRVPTLYVSAAQDLITFPCEAGFQLKTRRYWYKIFDVQPDLDNEPLFRWEYVARSDVPEGAQWCRHHFQIGKVSNDGKPRRAVELALGGVPLDLNRLHMPTGFVLIEYVLRFLITEFGVPTAKDWEKALGESEEKFFRKFSSKTSSP